MIERIISCLETKGVKRFVNTSAQLKEKTSAPSDIEWYYVEDVRSAVFNAYGMSKISHEPVAILVEEAYLPNTYTALTEAWFQRVPVILLALNSKNLDSSSYLNRCIDASFLINSMEEIEGAVCNVLQHHGPTLLKIKENVSSEEKIDYTNFLPIIESCFKDTIVFCYNPLEYKNGYEIIKTEYKYGVLSKYVGQLAGGKKALLCIPEELLALDTNVFNLRIFPQGFKLLVKYTDGYYWNKIKKWMQKNNIKTVEFDSKSINYATLKIDSNYAVLVK